jgi:hypothetical protein
MGGDKKVKGPQLDTTSVCQLKARLKSGNVDYGDATESLTRIFHESPAATT